VICITIAIKVVVVVGGGVLSTEIPSVVSRWAVVNKNHVA